MAPKVVDNPDVMDSAEDKSVHASKSPPAAHPQSTNINIGDEAQQPVFVPNSAAENMQHLPRYLLTICAINKKKIKS